jgi:hypothetical protein
VQLVSVLAVVHNFIRLFDPKDRELNENAGRWLGSSVPCRAVSLSCLSASHLFVSAYGTFYIILGPGCLACLPTITSLTLPPLHVALPFHPVTPFPPQSFPTSRKLKPPLLLPTPHTTRPLQIGVDSVWFFTPTLLYINRCSTHSPTPSPPKFS